MTPEGNKGLRKINTLSSIDRLSGLFLALCLLTVSTATAQEGSLERSKAIAKQEIEKAEKQIAEAEAGIRRAEELFRKAQSLPQTPDNVTARQALQETIRNHKQTILRAREAMQIAHERLALLAEQEEFEKMNAAWLRKQEDLIRQAAKRVAGEKKWEDEVSVAIQSLTTPETFRPKTLKDLKPGDILLVAPEDPLGKFIAEGDRFVRVVEHLSKGEIFKAAKAEKTPVSHAVTFVKSVEGKLLFLDHTSEGSRILNEAKLIQKYGHRRMYVARPQEVADGRKLWQVAREAALRKRSDYGLFGDNAVCSERAGIAVARSTGLPLEQNRLGPIDITPGDFFDDESTGKYFIVSPLQK